MSHPVAPANEICPSTKLLVPRGPGCVATEGPWKASVMTTQGEEGVSPSLFSQGHVTGTGRIMTAHMQEAQDKASGFSLLKNPHLGAS